MRLAPYFRWLPCCLLLCFSIACIPPLEEGVSVDDPGTTPGDPNDPNNPNHPNLPGQPPTAEECAPIDQYFETQVWARVAEPSCVNCHVEGGLASVSSMVLDASDMDHNFEKMSAMASQPVAGVDDLTRLLAKATAETSHVGGIVVRPGTLQYDILDTFTKRINDPEFCDTTDFYEPPPFFENVTMIDDLRLLRRVTLQLGSRLPTDAEKERVRQEGLPGVYAIMDDVMTEDAFYVRIKEAFNDILLTNGYPMASELALSGKHYGATRGWPGPDVDYSVWATYRDLIRQEPLEFVAYIVKNDLPFTEVLTADYMVLSPYTARGYGVFEDMQHLFEDPEDPYEFVPYRLPALTFDDGSPAQVSPTGFYPHAGLLTHYQFTRRYPTTDTNRNRLRSNTFSKIFLGQDILESAPLASDSAAIDTQFDNPTMEAPDCVVCHTRLDPVAGLFQDYNENGHFEDRDEGWYTDMFPPGFDGETMPESETWRSLQWLGERAAQDPRFAIATVEHAYRILFNREVLPPPQDINSPIFDGQRRAYQQQRILIEDAAQTLVDSDFNFKVAFKELALSEFYRADALTEDSEDPIRLAEIDDIGAIALLSPTQLDRQLHAIFGRTYFVLLHRFELLYGGIDSLSINKRLPDPSGAMGAIQRIIANDVPCNFVPEEFNMPAEDRRMFGAIEKDVFPGSSDDAEARIRDVLVDLHYDVLGRTLEADSPRIDRAYNLFADLVATGQAGIDSGDLLDRSSYICAGQQPFRGPQDPHFTVRAWRATLAFMIRQPDFLYQ